MSTPVPGDSTAWGRVADDGTVYVRTPEGERVVGSWQAGDKSAALAFFARRYDDLAAEVGLLETRFATGKADATHTLASANRIRATLPDAKVVGDLAGLTERLDALEGSCKERLAAEREAKAAWAAANVDAKRKLVDEAERLATSSQWKTSGDRLREIADSWRDIRIDRKTDGELWARLRTARSTFAKRRSEHFAALSEQRAEATERKRKLVMEAEALASSTDWRPTSSRLKALMREWKEAGRADRQAETDLWQRFRAAQDAFFNRLAALNAERDATAREGQQAREALLVEAEAIDVDAGVADAQARLRSVQERWEKTRRPPREVEAQLDERLATVARKVREATDAQWRESTVANSPLVIRLRESVGKLEKKIERARAAGRDAEMAEAQAALDTQREWLTQAERGG